MLKPGLVGAARLVTIAAVFAGWFPTAVAQDATGPAAAPPASRPAPAAASPQTTTRPANVGSGVVGAALHELYVIPRDGDQAGTDSGGATAPQSSPRARTASSNAPAANRQRAATSKLPPSTAPAASSSRGAKDAGSASAEPTHVYPGIPAGYRSGRRLSTNDREWANYRYYGGQPSKYGYGMYDYGGGGRTYGGYGPYDGYGYDEGDVYRFGFMQGYDKGKFDRTSSERAESVAAHASLNVAAGLQFFRKGDYRKAADAYQLASELDQGDPAARLCAGHALFALGRYREACRFIRRAFELQPRIAYLTYDIRGDYDDRTIFDEHLQALRKALEIAPRDPDRLFMLGYVLYYSNHRAESYSVFAQLLQVDKNDKLASSLCRNAQPSDVEIDAARAPAKPAPTK